jgi:hypothetical protein
MATNNTKTTTAKTAVQTKTTASTESNTGISKTIKDNTPAFVSNGISIATKELESFRLNTFNSPYIFYPILGIILFLILRHLWRRFF